jgi:xylulose-5-phosphate/fructose-6-phosphate phosphoketolase
MDTCPKEIDGKRTEDYWRSHQVPMGEMHDNPAHVRILEEWMKSYRPAELFDDKGRLRSEIAQLAPRGNRRMSANPHRMAVCSCATCASRISVITLSR